MQNNLLTTVFMPLMLAFIMFALGLGLTPADFRRIAASPRALLLGVLTHFVLLPLVCLTMLTLYPLPGALAVGFMLIAACPTGTTSNLLSYIARGDVALALSFTAVASLLTIFTLPVILSASMTHFMGAGQKVDFPVGLMMGQIFAMLGLPVGLGMLVRHLRAEWALRHEKTVTRLGTLCFFVIVIGAVVKNWDLITAGFTTIAPLAVALNVSMLALGYAVAKLCKLDQRQSITIAIEASVQNATLAVVVGSSFLHNDELIIPGAVYGVLMYAGGLAFAYSVRSSVNKEHLAVSA